MQLITNSTSNLERRVVWSGLREFQLTQILHGPPNPPYEGGNKNRKLASPRTQGETEGGVNKDSGARGELRESGYRWEAIAREEVVAVDEFRLEEPTPPEARGRPRCISQSLRFAIREFTGAITSQSHKPWLSSDRRLQLVCVKFQTSSRFNERGEKLPV